MNFDNEYHLLLKRQVEEEINYLVAKGHNTRNPVIPCTFCTEFKGHNVCTRLAQLKQFLSEIMVKMGMSTMNAAQLGYQPALSETKLIMPLIGFSD